MMIDIAIPKCNLVEDYDEVMSQVPDFTRPEMYIVYQGIVKFRGNFVDMGR